MTPNIGWPPCQLRNIKTKFYYSLVCNMSDHLIDVCETWYEHVATILWLVMPVWWLYRFVRCEVLNVECGYLFAEKMTGFGM